MCSRTSGVLRKGPVHQHGCKHWYLPTVGTWGSLLSKCATVLEVWVKTPPYKTFYHSAVPHSTEPQLTWLCIYPCKEVICLRDGLYNLCLPACLRGALSQHNSSAIPPICLPSAAGRHRSAFSVLPNGIFHLCRYIKNPYPMFTWCCSLKEAMECVPDIPRLSLSLEELPQADKREINPCLGLKTNKPAHSDMGNLAWSAGQDQPLLLNQGRDEVGLHNKTTHAASSLYL